MLTTSLEHGQNNAIVGVAGLGTNKATTQLYHAKQYFYICQTYALCAHVLTCYSVNPAWRLMMQ